MAKSMPQARSVLEFHPTKAKGEIYIHPPTTSLSLLPCKSLQMLFFWLVGPAGDLHWSIFLQDTYYMLLEGMRKSEQQAGLSLHLRFRRKECLDAAKKVCIFNAIKKYPQNIKIAQLPMHYFLFLAI